METALAALDYDPEHDRLFSLGDLIDYGPRSGEALEWLQTRFTGTVRGNHEGMMLNAFQQGARLTNEGGQWRMHWASNLPRGARVRVPAQRLALESFRYKVGRRTCI